MLDVNGLTDDIKSAIKDTIPNAIKTAMFYTMPNQNKDAEEMCEEMGKHVAEELADSLASRIATAIDSYVRCMEFQGTILTTGSPVAQQAVIFPSGMPVTNGKIPNTLGIL